MEENSEHLVLSVISAPQKESSFFLFFQQLIISVYEPLISWYRVSRLFLFGLHCIPMRMSFRYFKENYIS